MVLSTSTTVASYHTMSPPERPFKRQRRASSASNGSMNEEHEYVYQHQHPPPPPPSSSSHHFQAPSVPAHSSTLAVSSNAPPPNYSQQMLQQPPTRGRATSVSFIHHPAYPTFPPHPPPNSKTMSSTNGPRHYGSDRPTTSSSSSSGGVAPLPPLSLSILGVEPLDEFIKEVADFVHHMITHRRSEFGHLEGAVVEVEAKIGILKDRAGGRLTLPVLVESIVMPDSVDVRFESNMSVNQHKHFNALLNNLKTSSMDPATSASPLDYSHLYLVDTFYPSAPSSGSREKIRVTRDEKTGSVVQCVKKIRLGDLNIYSPKRHADWRVSVNLEVPVPLPWDSLDPLDPLGSQDPPSPSYTRRKDRMRYTHEEFVIDLTQVTTHTLPNAPPQEILHELELEIARPKLLLSTASKRNDVSVSEHERSAFDELIRAFVNNARILVRNSSEGW